MIVDLVRGQAVGDGTDSLFAIENVLGSSFDDRLLGNRGANVLIGSDGNDISTAAVAAMRFGAGQDAISTGARDGRANTLVGGPRRIGADGQQARPHVRHRAAPAVVGPQRPFPQRS